MGRASKLAAENELKLRNAKKKETDKKFHNAHEQKPKKIAANSKNWDNDWEKINKQRAEIKAIKEKKRMSKLAKENELKRRNSQRKSYGNSAHEAKPKKMKGVDRNGLNEDKVNKKRAEIKALKEKKRIEKAQKAEAEALAASARGRSSSRSKKESKATKVKTKKKKKADTESDSDSDDASHDATTSPTVWGGDDIHSQNLKTMKADMSKEKVKEAKRNKVRAELEERRKKKAMQKLSKEEELKQRNAKKKETDKKFSSKAHEKAPKKIKAKERVGTDWDKIEKQRAEIRRIKEKRRMEKEQE